MRIRLFAVAACAAMTSRHALAQSATQAVAYEIDAVNQIAIGGTPSLQIGNAPAGSLQTSVQATSTTWSVTTSQTGAKVTASISTAMPDGVTLSAQLGAPTGATSAGLRPLGTTAVDVVTGITKENASGLSLKYQLDATAAGGAVGSAKRVVTYTITGGA